MAFQKLLNFSKTISDLSDKPALTPAALKAQFDSSPNELKDALNSLIDALKLTASGDSGAKNIGAATISGLSGNDVQTVLESLKTYVDGYGYKKADTYTKTEVDEKDNKFKYAAGSSGTIELAVGSSYDFTLSYPSSRFTTTPTLTYSLFNSDIDEAYTMASGIVAVSQTGATIRVKNKGTTTAHVIVTWQAIQTY